MSIHFGDYILLTKLSLKKYESSDIFSQWKLDWLLNDLIE